MIDLIAWENALANIVLKWGIGPKAARELRELLFSALLKHKREQSK